MPETVYLHAITFDLDFFDLYIIYYVVYCQAVEGRVRIALHSRWEISFSLVGVPCQCGDVICRKTYDLEMLTVTIGQLFLGVSLIH